jgi:cohesin loading factor subunit SCC2
MDVDESAEQPALAEEESRIIKEALDNSRRSTSIITLFLVQKASGNKNTKVSADTDFKIILDAVVSDLLRVLYRPEWPAAAEFVNALSKYLVNSSAGEASTTKSVALDYLGDIGARLRTLQLQMAEPPKVCSLDEIIANPKLAELNKLNEMHLTLEGFLASAARDDSMYQVSRSRPVLVI